MQLEDGLCTVHVGRNFCHFSLSQVLILGLGQGYFEDLSILAVKKQMLKGRSVLCIEESPLYGVVAAEPQLV